MLVIFISECNKKAINRTRLVLDSFANRIGSRTWQTFITQEGLLEVKRLLSKTATKNTAVSCFWHRSRICSELLWIIGNRNMFNNLGMIPVNTTKKKIFIEKDNMESNNIKEVKEDFLANKPNNQSLAEHLFAVGFLAYKLFEKATGDKYPQLKQAIFLAGILHDIGKVQQEFQLYIQNKKIEKLAIYDKDNQYIDIDNNDSKTKNYFDENIRHNELSLLIFNFFEEHFNNNISYYNKSAIKHIIYYHHAKPFRKEDINKISELYDFLEQDEFKQIIEDALKVLKQVNNLREIYDSECNFKSLDFYKAEINVEDFKSKIKDINIPEFKNYAGGGGYKFYEKLRESIQENAENNLLRSCLISADRKISALHGKELFKLIKEKKLETILEPERESNLSFSLGLLSDKFPPDNSFTCKQNDVANELAKINNITVLQGPAGCGKTRIALEWARIKQAKKIIWICPRVQICQGVFQELSNVYLKKSNIEIFTSEFKYINSWKNETQQDQYCNGDVVVTTIDQVLNFIRSHTKVDELLDFMSSHIVFDEFHEFINLDIFNILFAELIADKKMCKNKNTLLVSATPNYIYLKQVLDVSDDCIKKMQSFNKSRYKIEFKEFSDYQDKNNDQKDEESIPKQLINSPFFEKYTDKTTFIISNNIIKAQLGFLYNYNKENSILFHSKFRKSDKQEIFKKVYNSFKQNGTNQFQTLRSGPIIQASLNISCDYMVSEISTAENILQRLGRLDRFGKNEEINQFDILITSSIKDGAVKGSCAGCLRHQNIFNSTKSWYKFLNNNFTDINNFELNQIYEMYENFYKDKDIKEHIKQDLEKIINKSINQINKKILDPIRIKPKPTDSKDENIKISSNSLRGDNNRFIQLAICDVTNYKDIKYLDKYAYDVKNNGEKINNLTDSFSEIFYQDESNKKFLYEFMEKYFFDIFPDKKQDYSVDKMSKTQFKKYKQNLFFNYAKDPHFPIYLSYISSDLKGIENDKLQESLPKDKFIYYAICSKQAVGIISAIEINNFFNINNEVDNE